MSITPGARIASLLLKRPVGEFIEEHRANGCSWAEVSARLRDETSDEVSVSEVSLRAWLRAWEALQAESERAAS